MGHITVDGARTAVRAGREQWFTVPLSMLVHTVVLGVAVVVPLVATGALPTPQAFMRFVAVAPPPPVPFVPRVEAPRAIVDPSINPNAAPIAAADAPAIEPPPGAFGPSGADVSQLGLGPAVSLPPTPVPAAPLPVPTQVFRVGGDVTEPRKLRHVAPVYPAIARAAHVQGLVILEAVIGTDGVVRDARVLRSHPLLEAAAIAAVREWRYQPGRLNGHPVDVLMTVTVTFTLGGV